MTRQIVGSALLVLVLAISASAQVDRRGNVGGGTYSGANFGTGNYGLGNAGGFATGPGFSNGTTNSNNFGSTIVGGYRSPSIAPGAMQGIPGISNYGGGLQSNFGGGVPAIGYGPTMPMGMNGFVPGIAPPGFTKDMFGYDVGIGSDDSGYTDFGNAMTYSALGLGFGGMGFGGPGFGGMGYGPMGYSYPGMVPGTFIPGVGYASPADIAAAASINGAVNGAVNAPQSPIPARAGTTRAGATIDDSSADGAQASAASNAAGNANANRRSGVRRSFLNDNVPLATANAVRIQNRLHMVKSPNLKNIKVMIANRTAVLSGTVDSAEDAQFASRMVGLEPGVVEVKSELTVNGEPLK